MSEEVKKTNKMTGLDYQKVKIHIDSLVKPNGIKKSRFANKLCSLHG